MSPASPTTGPSFTPSPSSCARRAPAQKALGSVPVLNPSTKKVIPFSANKPRTNGWIIFFNAFNLAFGSYFLFTSLAQGAHAIGPRIQTIYSFVGSFLVRAGISPVPLHRDRPGNHPCGFLRCLFLVPLLRRIRLGQAERCR